uniref:helix-turn-helix domain-containing protein n=1 Tax=Pseudonocardia sp. CA-138482 TaxID=3240023 RepID=UPI003F49200D
MTLSGEMSRVQPDTPKPPNVLRLLAELRAREATSPGGAVAASNAELARVLGVSRRTIQRSRDALQRSGLLGVTRPGGQHNPNNYELL